MVGMLGFTGQFSKALILGAVDFYSSIRIREVRFVSQERVHPSLDRVQALELTLLPPAQPTSEPAVRPRVAFVKADDLDRKHVKKARDHDDEKREARNLPIRGDGRKWPRHRESGGKQRNQKGHQEEDEDRGRKERAEYEGLGKLARDHR